MTAHRITVLGVLVFASVGVAAPVPKSLKAKAVSFDGKWTLVRQNNNDREVPKISPWIWEINGTELILQWPNGDGTFRQNKQISSFARPADAESNEMDYLYDARGGGNPSKGRATIEGDEFVVCWTSAGQPRPSEIKPGPGVNYYRFKRMTEK